MVAFPWFLAWHLGQGHLCHWTYCTSVQVPVQSSMIAVLIFCQVVHAFGIGFELLPTQAQGVQQYSRNTSYWSAILCPSYRA